MRTIARRHPVLASLIALSVIAACWAYWYITTRDAREFSRVTFNAHCASCHGVDLRGGDGGPNLLGGQLQYGDDVPSLVQSIEGGIAAHNDLSVPENRDNTSTKALALLISETRQAFPTTQDSYFHVFEAQRVESTHHDFHIAKYSDLESRPYSIEPLPDGRLLVAEKVRGLSIVDSRGHQGALIKDAPIAHGALLSVGGVYVGWGQLLDIELHPDYADNGWIYLSYTERCGLGCGVALPQTMVKVVRGRIENGAWRDQETIWSVHQDYYTIVPDNVASGRLAFDQQGHVFVTVGGKAPYKHLHDMDTPYGKIHRVRDDGTVPPDNPFWTSADQRPASSTRHTVWSFGHRTAQGLTANPGTGDIWNSEMGPRGGDEVNLIVGGGNYGWPLYTNGLDYDSNNVQIGKDLGLQFPVEDTVLPVVDFTPAPALSNLTFYDGETFTQWKNDILIGSLKAMTVYRLRIQDGALEEMETLVRNIGRVRDIEVGADGLVYIAIEHGDTGSIVRLYPGAYGSAGGEAQ